MTEMRSCGFIQAAQAELAMLREQHAAFMAAEATALGQVQQLLELERFRIAEGRVKGQERSELQDKTMELHEQLLGARQELGNVRTKLQVLDLPC
jgi:hypothetical protein